MSALLEILGWGVAGLVGTALFALICDAFLRRFLPDQPILTYRPGNRGTTEDCLSVLLPAAQVDTDELTARTRGIFARIGATLTVTPNRKRFNADLLVAMTVGYARGRKTVVLVAHSFSLQLAFRIARELEDTVEQVVVISIDGLPHKRAMRLKGLGLAKWLSFGPIFNLLSRIVWRVGFRPDPEAIRRAVQSDDPLHLQQLIALHESYRSYPLSGWRDQLCSIDSFTFEGRLPYAKLVYVASANDTIVNHEVALEHCRRIVDRVDVVTVEGAGHLALLDWPDEYATAITDALVLGLVATPDK